MRPTRNLTLPRTTASYDRGRPAVSARTSSIVTFTLAWRVDPNGVVPSYTRDMTAFPKTFGMPLMPHVDAVLVFDASVRTYGIEQFATV